MKKGEKTLARSRETRKTLTEIRHRMRSGDLLSFLMVFQLVYSRPTDGRTGKPMDGHTLLQRCENLTKKKREKNGKIGVEGRSKA